MEVWVWRFKTDTFEAEINDSHDIGSQLTIVIIGNHIGSRNTFVGGCTFSRQGREDSFIAQALVALVYMSFRVGVMREGLICPAGRRRIMQHNFCAITKIDDIDTVELFVEYQAILVWTEIG